MKKIAKEKMLAETAHLTADDNPEQQKWESGEYGRDLEHMRVTRTSDKIKAGRDPEKVAAMKAKKKSIKTSIRLSVELINDLTELASSEGFDGYQTYVKTILSKHVREKKKA